MLYENYYKKVSIIARILNQIRRFRKWLIGLLIAVIVAFCIFMVLQGTIYGDKLEADEVVYGENVSFEARALFRDVSYEFSEDSEFSKILTETPKMPGEYSIRAVSKSFFGKPKYGKAHKFTIVPREINVMVAEQQIIYGDLPNVKAELVYDDKITCDGYSYEDITLKQTKVIPKSEAIRIFDENNKDVTYAYIVKPVQTDIGFTPRDITITIDDVSREYNGQPFFADLRAFAVTDGTLANWGEFGQDMAAATYSQFSLLDIGSSNNYPDVPDLLTGWYVTHPEENKDVTHHYNISVVNGSLTVLVRPIVFNIPTDDNVIDFTYDADPHSFTEYTIDSRTPLAAGHKEKLLSGYPVLTDVGQKPNKLSFKIFDAEGRDVTFNHYCTYVPDDVILKVSPRPVNINMLTDETVIEHTYDATELSFTQYEIDKKTPLVSGHRETLTSYSKITNVGSVPNELVFQIKDNSGKDVTKNYTLTTLPEKMTLKVEPRPVNINMLTDKELIEFTYDAEEHSFTDFEVDTSTPLVYDDLAGLEHTAVAADYARITNVGEIPNAIDFKIFDQNNVDVTANYIVTVSPEDITLKVNPKQITLQLNTEEKTYDGIPLEPIITIVDTLLGEEIELFKNHDYDREKIQFTGGSRVDVGETYNEIVRESISIVDGDNGDVVTDNYEIELTAGTLTITQLQVIIQYPTDLDIVYDGAVQSRIQSELLDIDGNPLTGVLASHLVVPVDMTQVPTVQYVADTLYSNITNKFDVIIVEDGRDVSGNYEILEYIPGELKMVPRPIEIAVEDKSKVYDATPLVSTDWTISETQGYLPIIDLHEVVAIEIVGSITNVLEGPALSSIVEGSVKIADKDTGTDVTENYAITLKSGTLTVTKRPINITASNGVKIYDDLPLTSPISQTELQSEGRGLISSLHMMSDIIVTSENVLIDAGETANLVLESSVDIVLVDDPTQSVLSNYEVNLIEGKLIIFPRPIRINTYDGEWTYDAEAHFNKTWSYADAVPEYTILGNHNVEVGSWSEIINYIEDGVENRLTLKITDANNTDRDVSKNYAVEIVEVGTLFINKRDVYVETFDGAWTYDGNAHDNKEYEYGWDYVYKDDPLRQFVAGQTVAAENWSSIVNFIEDGIANEILFKVTAAGEDVTYNYNIITEAFGTLFINKRDVYIETLSQDWLYDGEVHANKEFETGWKYVYDDPLLQAVIGQTVVVDEFSDIINFIEGGKPNVITFKIMNEDTDVTYNYNVNVDNSGILMINRRKITVITDSQSWLYDGDWHSWDRYSVEPTDGINGILEGHTHNVKLDTITRIMDVVRDNGNVAGIDNAFEIEIFDAGTDVTYNYEITYEYGELEVTPRDLEVKTDYHMWADDYGSEFFDDDYHIIDKDEDGYGLIDRHLNSHRVDPDTVTKISVIGQKENRFSIIITEGEKDVTGNYDIEYIYGILFLVDDIRVTTEGDSKIYDGTALTNPNYSTSVLPDGCRFDGINVIGTQTNVGTSENEVEEDKVKVFYNNEEVECNVDFTYGILEVTLRYILIHTESNEWVYDGIEHSLPRWDCYEEEYEGTKYLAIAPNQYGDVDDSTITKILNVVRDKDGNVIAIENRFVVNIFDANDTDVTKNYSIEYVYGTLKVTPRPITIGTQYKEMIYADRIPAWNEFVVVTTHEGDSLAKEGLLDKHRVSEWAINSDKLDKNVGLYTVEIIDGTVVIVDRETGEVVTDNYDITLVDDSLNIKQRPITIHTNYHMWTDEVTGEKFDTGFLKPESGSDYGFVSGHVANAIENTITKINGIGSVRNEFKVTISNAGGEDVTKNYKITYEYGMLFVTDEIKIVTYDAEKIYDGTPLTNKDYYKSTLIGGCEFKNIVVTGSLTDVGEEDNTVDTKKAKVSYYDPQYGQWYDIVCENDPNLSNVVNGIEYEYGTLTVTKRKITIQTHSNKWLYDGAPHSEKGYTVIDGDLAPGQVFDVIESTEIVSPGIVDNEFLSIRITQEGFEKNLASNYEISYELGTLEIVDKKTIIVIKLKDIRKEYDGKPLEFNESCFEIQEEDPELEFSFTEFTSITLPGSLTSEMIAARKLPFKVIYQGFDVGPQCEIQFMEGGGLTVTEREITLKASDAIKEYDGSPLRNEKVELFEGELVEGHQFYAKAVGSNIDQDEVENVVDKDSVKIYYIDPNTGNEVDVTACYKISYLSGKLQIK